MAHELWLQAVRLEAFESVLPGRIFVFDRLVGGLEDQFEIHKCWSRLSVHRWPARLVNDGDVGHPERSHCFVGTEREAA